VFEQLKQRLEVLLSRGSKNPLSSAHFFFLGALSKLCATSITFPYIVIKCTFVLLNASKRYRVLSFTFFSQLECSYKNQTRMVTLIQNKSTTRPSLMPLQKFCIMRAFRDYTRVLAANYCSPCLLLPFFSQRRRTSSSLHCESCLFFEVFLMYQA
jgi:hypothetical protein